MDAILKWLGLWLLEKLTPILDPEAAARAQKLLARNNKLDQDEKALEARETAFHDRLVESDKKVAEWQAKTVELDNEIAVLGKKFAADTEVRKGLEDDLQKDLADIDARAPIDRIDKPLPGTSGN